MSLLNEYERQQAKEGWLKIVDSQVFKHMQLLITEELANLMLIANSTNEREEIANMYKLSTLVYDKMIQIANEMRTN